MCKGVKKHTFKKNTFKKNTFKYLIFRKKKYIVYNIYNTQ
jgi:hypothetical protein